MKVKAAITEAKESNFIFKEVTLQEPKINEIRIKYVASGVCHTDAVARDIGLSPFPVILGHEGSGIVDAIGEGVVDFEIGDHIVVSYAHCGKCKSCLTGHPTVCSKFNDLNFGGKMEDETSRIKLDSKDVSNFFGQSSFSTHGIVNSRNAVKVDKEVDLSLLGPLGCGIQTGAGTILNRLKPEFGSNIVVYGCGAVGLSGIMAAKIIGCKNIIAVDIHESRLNLALELGATHVLNGKKVDVVKEIKSITDGGSEYALETTGAPPVVKQSLNALRPLGVAAIVGVTPEMKIDIHNDLMAEGKTMVGVIEGDSVPRVFIPELIAYYREGRFPFDKLIKFYNFSDIEKAFEDSKNGSTIKPIIKF